MSRARQAALLLAVAAIAAGTGYQFYLANRATQATQQAAQELMRRSLPDADGGLVAMSKWRGKVLVVNFWATWCAPCRDEIPELIKIHRKNYANGVEVVGIGIDNTVKVQQYSREMSIDYALLIGGMDILDISKALGNAAGVLPFTVVMDRAGKLTYAHAGAITEAALTPVLVPLLSSKPL